MNNHIIVRIKLFSSLLFICSTLAQSDILDAKKYFEFNDYGNCVVELKNILRSDKSSAEAYRLYQDVMLQQDYYPALLKEFKEKVNSNPDDYLYNYLYGRLLVMDPYSNNLAEMYIKKSIEINPKFPWGYLPLAKISISKHNFEKSIKTLEECIQKCGDFVPAYLISVYCYQMLYGIERTITKLEEYLKRIPLELDLSLILADLYCKKNEIKKAEALLKKNENIYKNDYRYHRIIHKRAICTASNKTKKKLLEFYWETYPNSLLILSVFDNLFNIYKNENINKALRFARNAINYRTKIIKLKSNAYKKLLDFFKNRDSIKIIQIGNDAIYSKLKNPNILIQLGSLILEYGNAELAISLFDEARNSCEWKFLKNDIFLGPLYRENDKDNVIAFYLNRSYLYLGKAYLAHRDYNKALESYRKITTQDSYITEEIHVGMAKCYISLNNHNKAMNILLKSYKKLCSPKLLDLLKTVYVEKHGSKEGFTSFLNNSSNIINKYENINNIGFFSEYKSKILILTMHLYSCNECNKIIEVLAKLEKSYNNDTEIIFINLYKNKEPKLNIKSITKNKDLHNELLKELNVNEVPYTFIIDKKGNIRYRQAGFENRNMFKDFTFIINTLSNETR